MSKDKSNTYIRLERQRKEKVIESIRILSNLSNKGNYEFTEKQVNQLFKDLENCLNDSKSKFLSSCFKKKKLRNNSTKLI